jgi:hypothetical protein
MSGYEERLAAFAGDQRFARMSQPVRNRADAWCDACGSVQARLLFGLKAEQGGEVYFVGQNCLQALSERGAIVRRFSRESAAQAYAARCDSRAAPTDGAKPEDKLAATSALSSATPKAAGPISVAAILLFAGPSAELLGAPGGAVMPLDQRAASHTLALLSACSEFAAQIQALSVGGSPMSQESMQARHEHDEETSSEHDAKHPGPFEIARGRAASGLGSMSRPALVEPIEAHRA